MRVILKRGEEEGEREKAREEILTCRESFMELKSEINSNPDSVDCLILIEDSFSCGRDSPMFRNMFKRSFSSYGGHEVIIIHAVMHSTCTCTYLYEGGL